MLELKTKIPNISFGFMYVILQLTLKMINVVHSNDFINSHISIPIWIFINMNQLVKKNYITFSRIF